MASNIQSFPRMLKMLRENSNIKDKHEALTYIRSNSKKLETTKAIKEEQYKELCKLVIDAFANGNIDIQNEAYETLNVIIQDFRDHSLNLFETMWQISHKNRLKILKLLEVVEDNAISTVAYDTHTVNFFNNCMCTIKTNTMPWIAPTACIDNIQALIKAENKPLSDDQRLEEETINYCMILLRRLYKVAGITSDSKVERFNALLLDKIMLLAYMGHKRQRGPALKLLQQALATDVTSHIRTKLSDAWAEYKAALQSMYCKRMLLLVSACELDWTTQWNISIQFLGVDLHRGAGLINNLLSVEEKAFKSIDTVIRRQAFLSWKLLVDNFALDPQELATARRIKLLCIPLNAKNSKNELIALTKLEVWWHVIVKLYKDICKFVNPVITQFLNFCFGPLGDTPLLSSKFEIVASPGKRFYKTKIIAVDALCQLLVTKQENNAVFSPILEERLPHSMSNSVFQECYTSVIHSVGEALLVLSQLTDAEMKNRYQLGKILWSSLVNYVQESKAETKELVYKDLILVITELTNYAADKPMIRNLILDTIIFDITKLNQHFNFEDNILLGLVLRFLQVPLLTDANKIHYEILKSLFFQCIKSEIKDAYYSDAFKYLKDIYEKLSTLLSAEQKNESIIFELWLILAEVLIQYMKDLQDINEGNATEHNLKTVESIVIFPFMYMKELMKVWKLLYKQFEMRADLIKTVKTNQILLSVANAMQCCIVKNEKSCCLITKSLDTLLSTINYTFLLANIEVPSIIQLIVQLITCSLSNKNTTDCESALKALSAVLITIYGHNPQKVVSYLQVCKPAIELILLSSMDTIYKEVSSTWETVDYVFIKTDVKFDVSRLTEHQKESLKRRRDDIPALYNDLSQSSSQDTQNLQEWFDRKNKALEETEKTHTKKDNISMKNVLNHDANKENKIEIKESEIIDKATIQSDTKLVDHVGQNVTVEFVQNIKGDIENHENFTMKDVKVVEAESSSNCIADNTNLASQIENKDNGQRLSPSILDNGKRRNRSSTIIRSSNSSNLEEINNQPEQSTSTRAVERKLRTKVIQHKSKMLNKQGLPSNVHTKSFDMEKRGIKRKSTSDSESESTTQRRRRKTMPSETATDSDSSKSTESDNIAMYMEGLIDDGNLSQRTRNEISRLRINMIFDSPLPNSRRSKGHDDHIKEGVAKKQSPESKGTKPKFIDIKTGDSLRKTQRNTNKDLIKTQHVSRRGRPKVYSSTLKLGLTVDRHHDVTESENTKKTLQTKTNEAEEEQKLEEENQAGNNIRTDVSRTGVTDIECDKNGECNSEVGNKDLDSDGNIETTQDAKSVEQLTQTRDDTQDIIENSQELSELQKKCNEKQCFIKINKIGELCNSMKFQDVMVEDEEIADTASNSCDNDHNEVSKDDAKESEKISEVDTNKPKILTPTAENNSCDNVEVPKINEGSLMKSVIGFLSPKSNTKRLKFKSYSAQGRAAHMLGLVTKQARMETEGNIINIDDEAATKKVKLKDVESETVFGKKERGSTFKEADKVTATCSSRQEKIFNNMRSSDYCSSPPIKLFSNLKNDGEKFVSKVDKSVDSVSIQTDIQSEKVMEETSIEMDELPILEWSSANPPSLTASPSCSILKRQRQSPPVIEPECTTPKRKRVSFADPPVSMEMGYETGTSDSPHRVNKLTSRGLLGRKDSPLRMKQFKQRLIHIEIGKMECDEEIDTTNTSEVDLQCVRENELLTKIADELEYSENIAIDADNTQIPSSSAENDSTDLITAEEDAQTNNNTNTNDEHNISVENNSVEFSTTNDSITRHLFKSSINSENLEDTVDAGNLSGLNSTANSDEIFCGKFMRTSTQGVDSAEEQDTLPVTDSVFGSLPLSQDSQNTSEFDIEIPHPELLDSTLPLYPSLISCSEPVQCIIDKLTYPPWVQYLSTYFASRKLETVGDLARLSEREINRIPVKGNSKIECVKSVLKCFEKTHVTTETNDVTEYLNNAVNSKALISVNMDVSASETISQDQLSKKSSETIPNEDTSHTTDDVDITENKTTETSKNAAQQTLNEPVSSTLDVVTSEVDVGCSHASKTRAVSVLNASKTVASCTNRDSIYLPKPTVRKSTKSVEAQMALEDLLDEIDVNLVLESAVRRCTPEKILLQYKNKMRHVPQLELERETIRMLGSENRKNCNETTLKTACRACGINKVLLRLPDIFSAEKQFFVKVLNAYRQKIKTSDCLNILDFTEVKDTVCQKCTSSELAEMLSEKLKEEEQKGIKKPMTELSSLDAMLKRMPMDAIISHTVANDELIPSRVVLDIALQNNNPSDIAQALESQSAVVTKNIFDKLWSSQFAVEHIDRSNKSKEDLFKIFKAVSSKLSQQELLEAFYENMNAKITATEEKQ
ncbi:Telomere-associated protein RIF1 [Dufourea novaeangliae]|uniref:Telomere-associated protein RIF1 n=1 Tax=Dufourea novaeangliae TaxID=178035 RepID=A0A154P202_DUFNO|nr:Telomere-associated protein RIF1 [Dufourea novaeangliae]